MIKIFEEVDMKKLEKAVNAYIENCGSRIHDIQFRTSLNENGLILHVCIIHDLEFTNMYK